jgi:hypothetical protein
MDNTRISLIIDSICKEHGIVYESKNPHYQTFMDDAIKLGCIYKDLKNMIHDIKDIEIRHGLNGIKMKLEAIMKELDKTEHLILKVAKELMEKDKYD